MPECLELNEVAPLILEAVKDGGCFYLSPRGRSMLPTIREGKDRVVLEEFISFKKGDILLYRRKNGQFVLHRLVGFKNGAPVMCGDAQYTLEYGIRSENIIARVSAIIRKNKSVNVDSSLFKLYSVCLSLRRNTMIFLIKFLRPVKHFFVRALRRKKSTD